MSVRVQKEKALEVERPPSVIWRIAAIPVLSYALVAFLGLVSYNSADVSAISAPANERPTNWMGLFGAWNAYGVFLLMGLCAYLVPVLFFVTGLLMAIGKRLRLRVLWMLLAALSCCALMQFANAFAAPLLSVPQLNIAANAGGGIGFLLNDKLFSVWLGNAGSAAFFGVLLAVSIVMIIGPMNVMEYFYKLKARDFEVKRRLEDADSTVEDLAEARRAAREEERERRLEAKAREKEKRDEDREFKRAAREAAKAEKLAAKEARRLAAKNAEAGIDSEEDEAEIFAHRPKRGQALKREEVEEENTEEAPQTRGDRIQAAAKRTRTQKSAPASAFVANEISFKLPSTRLLKPAEPLSHADNLAEINENTAIIEGTLADFGINVDVTGVVSGPVITCYEIKPAAGVRVAKITNYSNDLQMALKAKSIRILSPIPGKDVMGIEIPNANRTGVSIRSVTDSAEWKGATEKFALPMLLGLDVGGKPVFADLAKMPHVLLAGTTGSGKSVCMNSIIAGLLLSRTPDDMRIILVDPKMVEFSCYADLPHLVVPVITAPQKVAGALQWAIVEMKTRLEMFRRTGVRNISAFNNRERAKQGTFFGEDDQEAAEYPDKLPYIVIMVDEMADLMMSAQAEIEPRIVSLAQLSRAVGIHMVLATQRPSVNVITGLIKANFPGRIALKVSQRVDSQTILDGRGAEHLIGNGDMLFSNPNGTMTRTQGTYISDGEIESLVNWYKSQGEPMYIEEVMNKLDKIVVKSAADEFAEEGAEEGEEEDADAELLAKALECIVSTRRASTSSIQRQLRIGYNRAARIMDELERIGCVGPANGSSPREILRTSLGEMTDLDNEDF